MKKIMTIAMLSMLAVASQAALVVDLSGNWNTSTSGNINYTLPTVNTNTVDTKIYNNGYSTAFLTNGQAGTGGSYQGPNLYGSIQQYNLGGSGVPTAMRAGSSDQLGTTAGTSTIAANPGELDFTYVVKKANFANGLNTGSIGFDTGSAFSFTGTTWTANSKSARAIVQNGSTWYMSVANNTASSYGTGAGQLLTNAASALWFIWDPNGNISSSTVTANIGTTVAGSTFTDIQAVGVYASLVETTTANSNPNYNITGIQIGAAVVPEPATVGMLGLGALITLLIRRIRR